MYKRKENNTGNIINAIFIFKRAYAPIAIILSL